MSRILEVRDRDGDESLWCLLQLVVTERARCEVFNSLRKAGHIACFHDGWVCLGWRKQQHVGVVWDVELLKQNPLC
jgi:hypothetical protein